MNKIEGLFDNHGRCLPVDCSYPANKISRRYFKLQTVDLNYEKIYNKIKNFLDPDTSLSLEQFKEKAEDILKKLSENKTLANIINGVGIPFFMPKRKHGDIGEELAKNYLNSLKHSFKEENPSNDFTNHCTDNLTNSISVNVGSKHDKFIDTKKFHSTL